MKKQIYISSLQQGQEVVIPLALHDKHLHQFTNKNGQPDHVLMLTVGDKSGTMAAVIWDKAQELHSSLTVDQVYLFQGKVGEYRGKPQLVIHRVQPLALTEVDPGDYVASGAFDREVLWQRLAAVIQSIQEPNLQALLTSIFDEPTRRRFILAPGGREVHHAYVGGLLEHTLEVVAYANTMLTEQGSNLNRDLLLTGCILHDIGKVEEYNLQSLTFQLTDEGRLLGHPQIGAQMVAQAASSIPGFPNELRLELEHMLLSHHGQPEWGAVQPPKTINAMALHLADLTSSRLSQFDRVIGEHDPSGGRWSKWDKFLARSIWVPEETGPDIL